MLTNIHFKESVSEQISPSLVLPMCALLLGFESRLLPTWTKRKFFLYTETCSKVSRRACCKYISWIKFLFLVFAVVVVVAHFDKTPNVRFQWLRLDCSGSGLSSLRLEAFGHLSPGIIWSCIVCVFLFNGFLPNVWSTARPLPHKRSIDLVLKSGLRLDAQSHLWLEHTHWRNWNNISLPIKRNSRRSRKRGRRARDFYEKWIISSMEPLTDNVRALKSIAEGFVFSTKYINLFG